MFIRKGHELAALAAAKETDAAEKRTRGACRSESRLIEAHQQFTRQTLQASKR